MNNCCLFDVKRHLKLIQAAFGLTIRSGKIFSNTFLIHLPATKVQETTLVKAGSENKENKMDLLQESSSI